MQIPNSVYNILKWVGLIALPALAWFISTIAPVWGIQNAEAIVVTINATGTLIGVLIGVSSIEYYKGGGEP